MRVTRKEFIQIAITFVSGGSAGVAALSCGDSGGNGGAGGTSATSSTKAATTNTSAGATTNVTAAAGAGAGAGGGDDPQTCGASGAQIIGNHGHVLVVPAKDLDSPTAKTYSIMGNATHNHTVTFSPANLQKLATGANVAVTSTTVNAHDHVVNAMCM